MLAEFQNVFVQLIVLFALIAVGYAMKKLHIMDEDFDAKFSSLVLNTALPALILASVLAADELPSTAEILQTILFSCLAFVVLIIAALVVTAILRVPVGQRGTFRFMLIFGNTGFLGYPVVTAIFGQEALIYACIYNLPFNLICFSLGVWLIVSDNDYGVKVKMKPQDFLSTCNVCCIIVIVLALLGIHDVPVLGDALDVLGDMTTPSTLLIVGSSLANLAPRELLGTPRLWAAALCRLLLMPALTWLALSPLLSGQLLQMLVILAGMPVATNGTILSYRYGGNPKIMAQGTFLTTVLSLATLPLIAAVLLA